MAISDNAKAVAIVYSYFEQMVNEKQMPAKNLTGTLSILGQAYLATDQAAKARGHLQSSGSGGSGFT